MLSLLLAASMSAEVFAAETTDPAEAAVEPAAIAEEATSGAYVLMNIPYADFYAGEGVKGVDAVTSATKNKPRTATLAGGSYHVNADGTDISGVTYPVYVADLSVLADYTEITDASAVSITVTNRGQTTTTEYTGSEALFEAPSYAYYVLSEVPAYYKILNEDGSFSAAKGEAEKIDGASAKITYNARHADIEISLTLPFGVSQGDAVSAVVLTDSEGNTYALRHVVNIWRGTEIGWNYEDFDLLGKEITNIRYFTENGIFDYPVTLKLKKDLREVLKAEFVSARTIVLSGIAASSKDVTVTVTKTVGTGRDAVTTTYVKDVTLTGSTVLIPTTCEPGVYTVTVNSSNYIPAVASAEKNFPGNGFGVFSAVRNYIGGFFH